MLDYRKYLVLVFIYLVASFNSFPSENEISDKEEFDPAEEIMHHIADAYEWHFFDVTDEEGNVHPISMPLPVILYANGSFDIFMSGEFDHGKATVTRGENTYILYHNKIYMANEDGGIDYDEEHHPMNTRPLDISITKNVFAMLLSAIIILLIFISVARAYRKRPGAPKGLQSFMEPIILFIRDDVVIPTIGEKKYHKYINYLLTVFFFIWINNVLGLLPGGANLTGNIAVTMTLAVFTLLITNFSGKKTYWGHIFATPGLPIWLSPIMIPIEMVGILAKPFALMIRLFANITAGHIIVLSLISLIFIFKTIYIAPVSIVFVLFMDILELFVAVLQAYIFTLLSSLFIGLAVQEHH